MEQSEIDGLYGAIQKLQIVKISINPQHGDDPQLIFESLNSTGLELEEADKVRNFILMGLDSDIQTHYYNIYWSNIEKLTVGNVSAFLRYYLAIKEQKLWAINKLYKYFKDYVIRSGLANDIEVLLKDLLKFAKYYNMVITAEGSQGYKQSLVKIKMLDFSIVYPFAMELFDARENNYVSDNDLDEIFGIIESYFARRIICAVDSSSLNKMFAFLGSTILDLVNKEKISYLVAFKYILLNKTGHYRFPRDTEFEEKLCIKDIYSIKSNYKKYLLAELENFDNREKIDVYGQLESGELTIEHIMPQTLSEDWKKELGADWKGTHNELLHVIGNLTLTAYNSKFSNKTFQEKCDMEKGFKESRLFLNKYVSNQTNWNSDTIKSRTELLTKRAINIWSVPECNFEKKVEENWIGLDEEDVDFTGKAICQYKFLKDVYPASDWTSMFKNVCKLLYKLDKNSFVSIVNKEFSENRVLERRFSTNISVMRNPYAIAEGIYVEINLNTQTKIEMLRIIFENYNIDFQDLSFKLSGEADE